MRMEGTAVADTDQINSKPQSSGTANITVHIKTTCLPGVQPARRFEGVM